MDTEQHRFCRPSGTLFCFGTMNPALKGWAIFKKVELRETFQIYSSHRFVLANKLGILFNIIFCSTPVQTFMLSE